MLTFTRVSTQHIGEVMNDAELALDLIQDRGFSLEDELDSDSLLGLLERRWQGQEQTYSFEKYTAIAQLVMLDIKPTETMALLFSGGRASAIQSEGKPLRVLSPLEVSRIDDVLCTLDLMQLQHDWMSLEKVKPVYPEAKNEDIDTFWMLFPGIVTFFQRAAAENQCVIAAWQAV